MTKPDTSDLSTKMGRKPPNRIRSFRRSLRAFLEDYPSIKLEDPIQTLVDQVDEDFYVYADETL